MLTCPKCHSDSLMIRKATGLELWKIMLTRRRKYWCQACQYNFRALDRRQEPRGDEPKVVERAMRKSSRK